MSESSDLSDIEAPGTRNAQDETPIIIETPARPPRNSKSWILKIAVIREGKSPNPRPKCI